MLVLVMVIVVVLGFLVLVVVFCRLGNSGGSRDPGSPSPPRRPPPTPPPLNSKEKGIPGYQINSAQAVLSHSFHSCGQATTQA